MEKAETSLEDPELDDPPEEEEEEEELPQENWGQEPWSEEAVPEIHFPDDLLGNFGLSRLPKEFEHVNPVKEKAS